MNNNNRIGQSEISNAIAQSVEAESHRIAELQSEQIADVNGATAAEFTVKSIVASVFGDTEDTTTMGYVPKTDGFQF